MQEIAESIQNWNEGERPLRSLTKAQLFAFPPTPAVKDKEWAFSKEVLARVVAMSALERRARRAAADLAQAHRFLDTTQLNLVKARERLAVATAEKDPTGVGEAKALIDSLERLKVRAHERIKDATEADHAMRVQIVNVETVDSVISQAEIDAHYAGRYGAEWADHVARFKALDLFDAQRWGFSSFMDSTKEARDRDMETYRHAEKMAYLCGQNETADFRAINTLWQIRIAPTLGERHRFRDEDGEIHPANLKDDAKRQYWAWFKVYNAHTRANKWMDDGGVAYDEERTGA